MEKRKRRKFTAEYKAGVVQLVRTSGRTIGQIAQELDLTETAVRQWVHRAEVQEAHHCSRKTPAMVTGLQ